MKDRETSCNLLLRLRGTFNRFQVCSQWKACGHNPQQTWARNPHIQVCIIDVSYNPRSHGPYVHVYIF